jgi:hypothetical protein
LADNPAENMEGRGENQLPQVSKLQLPIKRKANTMTGPETWVGTVEMRLQTFTMQLTFYLINFDDLCQYKLDL